MTVLVAQSCPTMSDSLRPQGVYPLSTEFSRQEYWSGLPFPFPRDLPDPGIEPRSPTLQADSLPSEPSGKWRSVANIQINNIKLETKISEPEVLTRGVLNGQ